MAREPTPQLGTVQLQPVASPVDTFVSPKRPSDNRLDELASSLGGVSTALTNYMSLKATTQQQADQLRAKADALRGDPNMAEAIRTGKIPPQYSPNYVNSYKETTGALSGGTLQEKWDKDFQQNTWKDSPDEGAYDKHIQQFVKDNLGSDDPAVLKGQLPYVQQLMNNTRAQWISYRANKLASDNLTASGALAQQGVEQAVTDGLSQPKGTDYDKVFSNLAERRAAFVATGAQGADWDKQMMLSMSHTIVKTQDPGLLKFFEQKVPGTDYTYGSTPDGIQILNQTTNALKSAVGSAYSQQYAQEEHAKKAALNDAQSTISRTLAHDPNGELPEDLIRQAENNGDPMIRTKIAEYRKNLQRGNSNPERIQAVLSEILQSPNVDPMIIVNKASAQGVYGTPEDLQKAVTFAQSFKNNQDKLRTSMDTPVAKKWTSLMTKQTTNVNDFGDPISGVSNAGNEAMFDYRRLLNQWMVDNPNATQPEIDDQADKFGKSISDRFVQNPDASGMGKGPVPQNYNRDPALGFDNPFDAGSPNVLQNPGSDASIQGTSTNGLPVGTKADGGMVKGGAVPAAGTQAPAAAQPQTLPNGAPAVGPSDVQVQKFIDKMPQDQQDRLKKALQFTPSHGNLQDYLRQYLTKNPNLIPASYDPNNPDGGQGDTRPSGGLTEQSANDYIQEALNGAKQMGETGGSAAVGANLKDLIAYTESKGNYNAVFGDTNSKEDLSNVSVDKVLAMQQWARQNGYPSTAIGKYGVIYSTLKSLKAEGVLDGTEPFNKVTQDKIADSLLNRRGLNDFLGGRLTQKAFALRLSQEWAGLPSPYTGKSFYEGDGLNRSLVQPSAVYSALGITPASYRPDDRSPGSYSNVTFSHPEQAGGVKQQLISAVSDVGKDLGIDPNILSGYRSPTYNAKVGGAAHSAHEDGDAVDINIAKLSDDQKTNMVYGLMARGVKRFITYTNEPGMLHVDLRDQRGDGTPYFMHDRTASKMADAPDWFKAVASGKRENRGIST